MRQLTDPVVPVPHVYKVTFSGPVEARDDFIATLRHDGLAAEPDQPMYAEESHLGWVRVLTHEGNDCVPPVEFQRRVNAQTDAIAAGYGFAHRAHGIVMARPSELRDRTLRRTDRLESKRALGRQAGIVLARLASASLVLKVRRAEVLRASRVGHGAIVQRRYPSSRANSVTAC
jgi:hypothetical protein